MTIMNTGQFPQVNVGMSDRTRLDGVVQRAASDRHPSAALLGLEMKRAQICADRDLPPDVVRINRWVTYRIDSGWSQESRILVCPEDYRDAAHHLSVLSPLGTALVGLRVGDRMPYATFEGVPHVAHVVSLDPPPGSMGLLNCADAWPQSGEDTDESDR
jgi:regulator of nucleoside diphosphate kinase